MPKQIDLIDLINEVEQEIKQTTLCISCNKPKLNSTLTCSCGWCD